MKQICEKAISNSIKVVVIDTGIEQNHPMFVGKRINGVHFFYGEDQTILTDNILSDEIGHGTAICSIISRCCPNAELFVIKIYQDEVYADSCLLVYALEYVLQYVECDVINLSLGCLYDSEKLRNVCKKISQKGIIQIAANDNAGAVSFPAAYPEVFGVDCSAQCVRDEDFIFIEKGVVNLLAKSGNTRVAWNGGTYRVERGISFSNAFMTATVARLLLENDHDKKQIRRLLRENSLPEICLPSNHNKNGKHTRFKIEKIKHAAVVPYNKEIHSLINFADMLPFEIVAVYDIRQRGLVGKKTKAFSESLEYIIEDYKKIDYFNIDTIIIGHLSELSRLSQVEIKRQILDECLAHGTNVFCFDRYWVSEYEEKFKKKGIQLAYPWVNENKSFQRGRLFAIESPILGVFGTSSSQGKFTVQLQIRKMLIEKGYCVGQLGTEPSAQLFGMDDVLPYGYERTVSLSDADLAETVNSMIHRIDKKTLDIILVGAQSNTVPYTMHNTDQMSLPQMSFLLGCNPDVVVLCVNLYDDIEYIKRTVLVMENLVECKVAGIAISPLYYPDDWHLFCNNKVRADERIIDTFKANIYTGVGLKSYVIGTPEIECLLEECLKYMT